MIKILYYKEVRGSKGGYGYGTKQDPFIVHPGDIGQKQVWSYREFLKNIQRFEPKVKKIGIITVAINTIKDIAKPIVQKFTGK